MSRNARNAHAEYQGLVAWHAESGFPTCQRQPHKDSMAQHLQLWRSHYFLVRSHYPGKAFLTHHGLRADNR